MFRRTSLVLMLVILLAGLPGVAPARAQDDPTILNFDVPEIITLSPGQTVARAFTVLAGDRFELRVIALAPIAYSASLVDPVLGIAPLTVDTAGSATLTIDPATLSGRYTLLLQPGDTGGDVVVQLSGEQTLPDPLAFNATTPVSLIDQPLRFRLDAQPAFLETLLTITRVPVPDQPEPVALPRVALMDAESGRMVAALDADALPGAALRLPANAVYLLAIEPGGGPADVELRWEGAVPVPGAGGQAPGGVTGGTPTFTPFPTITGTVTTTVTTTVTATLTPSVTGTLTATYTPDPNATATAIPSPTTQGEVDETATITPSYTPTLGNGEQPDPEPTLTSSYTPTAETFTDQQVPTATYTPSRTPTAPAPTKTPTQTFTPSYTPTTPPPPPTAPPDSNYSLRIPLDGTASITDFVSFPDGDTQDRVSWDVTGMNPNVALSGGQARLLIAVSCFGTGTQHVTFFTGGQTFSCGQTIVDREITADSRTGSVLITATGGTGTFVQWVVTGTATRLN